MNAETPSLKASQSRTLAFFVNCALLFSAVVLFALPHPNPISSYGFPFLAYVSFIPLFILVRRISFRASFIWGGCYGILCYCAYGYWLGSFHPLALYVIVIMYFFYHLLLVPLLKLADLLFPKHGFMVQWLVWIGYEYLKTRGFVGFSYGIAGYSQWNMPVLIQIASIFGVWGVSALVVFPSAWIAGGLKLYSVGGIREWGKGFVPFAREHAVSGFLWVLALCGTLTYGCLSPMDYAKNPSVKVALIQPNNDPWIGGVDAYRQGFDNLKRLSDKALLENPDIRLIVWPETAFVPRIEWHWRFREDPDAWLLVSDFLAYVNRSSVPFVVGTDDALEDRTADGTIGRIDYNAAFLFRPGENVIPPSPDRYRKMHLVPFTEHFPYRKIFPQVYDLLVANDTHFWEQGTDPVVFTAAGLSFATPICFEDTFGYLSRDFVRKGACAIVNLSNDAWAWSKTCQFQHLSMAVFRAVENRVPLVRATASGQTCSIDPNGRILAMAQPFTPTYLVASVPVVVNRSPTPYTLWGDVWGALFAFCAFSSLVFGMLTKRRH